MAWTASASLASTQRFLTLAEEEWAARRELVFAVLEGGSVVGTCGLRVIRPQLAQGEIGYWIRSDRTGRGYATEAAGALVDVGFDALGLERLELRAGVGNAASRRVAEKLGFRQEGLARQGSRGAEAGYDCLLYGLLATDPRTRAPAPLPAVRVRRASPEDLDIVRRLWRVLEDVQGAFRLLPAADDAHARLERSFEGAVASPDEQWVIAEAGEAVGMAHFEVVRPSKMSDEAVVELGRVVVDPAWRGRGVGGAILRAAEEFAQARGIRVLSARVFAANRASLAFWERSGFEIFLGTLVRRIGASQRPAPES